MTAYSDACWGEQFGNAVEDGTLLELFKFLSLYGYLVCMSGGSISWKSIRQDHTALSSSEAEIFPTNECVKDLQSVKLRAHDLHMIPENDCTLIFNDNHACINWSASCTTKGIKHISLREKQIRECHQASDVCVTHIPSIINPSDIFTKEIKDTTHFRRLRGCMMVSKSAFLKYHHDVPSEVIASERILPYYSLRSPQPPRTAR